MNNLTANNLPGIKSDKWIKAMSMVPQFMVTERRMENGLFKTVDYMTHLTEKEIEDAKARINRLDSNSQQEIGIIRYRRTTEEEKALFKPMIEPFVPNQVKVNDNGDKIVSYGTSSFGYDIRCAREFKIFTNVNNSIVDPKNLESGAFVDFVGDVCIVPPNSFVLARTVERFNMPDNVVGICLGKSTYARCGLVIGVTPLEPQWSGWLTLEFSNTTPLPVKLYANEGCGQINFYQGDEIPETGYKDRNGKYMDQAAEPVVSRV